MVSPRIQLWGYSACAACATEDRVQRWICGLDYDGRNVEGGHLANSFRGNLRLRNVRRAKGASKLEYRGVRRQQVENGGAGSTKGNKNRLAIFPANSRGKS